VFSGTIHKKQIHKYSKNIQKKLDNHNILEVTCVNIAELNNAMRDSNSILSLERGVRILEIFGESSRWLTFYQDHAGKVKCLEIGKEMVLVLRATDLAFLIFLKISEIRKGENK